MLLCESAGFVLRLLLTVSCVFVHFYLKTAAGESALFLSRWTTLNTLLANQDWEGFIQIKEEVIRGIQKTVFLKTIKSGSFQILD